MDILIWGAGANGKALKKICDKQGWKVSAFIDNDKSKLGELEGVSIISPDNLYSWPIEDVQIWIAAADNEVYDQAKKITGNVLAWKFVQLIITSQRRPLFPEVQLNKQNIQNCSLVKDREDFLKEFSKDASDWKMAEVGVAFGDFSEQILKICSPKKLYLVDLWEGERFGKGLKEVQSKFKEQIITGGVEICEGYSLQKLEEFEDGELDWVYIDTGHTYEMTKKELKLCRRKVRPDGYICGHDYAKYNVYSRCDYGVYDAVNEFAVNEGYEFIYLTMEPHGLQSFALRKIKGDSL